MPDALKLVSLNSFENGQNIVGQQLPTCWMLHVASVSTPCCMLLGVVAQSLKLVKLLATSKRTQHLPEVWGQQCWELSHPFARSFSFK